MNGGTSIGKYVTQLHFQQLSQKAAEAEKLAKFPTSLLSVGKLADDSNVSVFIKDAAAVYKDKDVLVTCKMQRRCHPDWKTG